MIHNVWNYPVGVYDDLFKPNEFADIIEKLDQTHLERKKAIDSFDYFNVPDWIQPLTNKMQIIFDMFCQEANIKNIYSPNFYQTQRTEHYGRHNAFYGNWEPHNDIYERANWSVSFYPRVDTESVLPDGYVGGELALMDRLDYSCYPDSVQLVGVKSYRVIIFSPLKVHRIRPYFGKTPRLSITQHYGREVCEINPDDSKML